jgi:quinone-modifying oxidoreductase, subunit QmoB
MKTPVLICGDGPQAMSVGAGLSLSGRDVIVALNADFKNFTNPVDDKIKIFDNCQVTACRGVCGDFKVTLNQNGQVKVQPAAQIIIATEAVSKPHDNGFGLKLSDSIWSLEQLSQHLEKTSPDSLENWQEGVAFLTGLGTTGQTPVMADVMQSALTLARDYGRRCFVFCDHVKVAGAGLEALFYAGKEAGVVYIRTGAKKPKITSPKNDSAKIEFWDETIQKKCLLAPAKIIVDEIIGPSAYLKGLIEVFKIEADSAGFAQTENVHRLTVFTSRPGILVAGGARAVLLPAENTYDCTSTVLAGLKARPKTTLPYEIDTGLCVHCLTCYRLCPYQAILLQQGDVVISDACEGCGHCKIACPRHAIHQTNGQKKSQALKSPAPADAHEAAITVFVCKRSAAQAAQLARQMQHDLPRRLKLIEVLCAGAVGIERLLTEFTAGADGVMLLSCHEDNCHAGIGRRHASHIVTHLAEALAPLGIDPQRIAAASLAANMASEFARLTNNFAKTVSALGQTGLLEEN